MACVGNATRAWDMVFDGPKLEPGARVLVRGSDYASNHMAVLQRARRLGIGVDLVPSDATGQIDVAARGSLIGPRRRECCRTAVPGQDGLVNPAQAVGAVARRHSLSDLLDGCQSAGQIALDVRAIGCRALSGTGHRFLRGPRGTGFPYVRGGARDRIEPRSRICTRVCGKPLTAAPSSPARRGSRPGIASSWADWGWRRQRTMRWPSGSAPSRPGSRPRRGRCGRNRRRCRGSRLHDLGRRRCGIVTFSSAAEVVPALAARLRAAGINTSVSQLAWSRLDVGPRGLSSVMRASVHAYNTEDEIARLVAVVAEG